MSIITGSIKKENLYCTNRISLYCFFEKPLISLVFAIKGDYVSMDEKYGLIVTIENYQSGNNTLHKCKYANADGELVRNMFLTKLRIPEANINVYKDEQVTKNGIFSEIHYWIKSLPEDSVLYLFYAGHGFYADGHNYCSLYDTSLVNLKETAISFDDFFLSGFKQSHGKLMIAFVDACSEIVEDRTRGSLTRTIILDELSKSYRPEFDYAIICASSPGQRSSSSDKMSHGVWTKMLCDALSENGISEDIITASMLINYLNKNVSEYCESSEELFRVQTTHAIADSKKDIIIIDNSQFNEDEFIDAFYDLLANFFLAIKKYYNDIINEDESVDIYQNYLVARDVCFEIADKFADYDWDMAITEIQMADDIMLNGDTRIEYTKQKQLLEILHTLLDYIE